MEDLKLLNLLTRKSLFWWPNQVDISAWTEHIPFAFWLTELLQPKTIVELGVHNGNSYFAFCQGVKNLDLDTTCYGIDTWLGDEQAGFYAEEVFKKVSDHNAAEYSGFSTLIRSTFDDAISYFPDESIDLLHIDGMHTYEAVKHDFETWRPKLKKDAIVIFHDINVREREFGVFKFWEELKPQYNYLQFDFGHGLGIIAMDSIRNLELQSAFIKDRIDDYFLFLRNYFFNRGHAIKSRFDISLQIKKKEESFYNLSEKHIGLEGNYKTLETHYFQLIEERKNLTGEIEGLKGLQNQFQLNIENLKSEKSESEKELQLLRNSFYALENQYTHFENNFKNLASAHQESLTALNRTNDNFNNVFTQYEQLKLDFQKNSDELIAKISETAKKLNGAENEIKAQWATIAEQTRIILWYKSTYEDRSLAGTIKEKLKAIYKKNFKNSKEENQKTVQLKSSRNTDNQSFKLIAENELTLLSGYQQYKSTGVDPFFVIPLDAGLLSKGWYILTVEIKCLEGTLILPKLYFDTGDGFNETNAWNLAAEKNGKIEGVVHFPETVLRLRFDPTSMECAFQVSGFKLEPVGRFRLLAYAFRKYKELHAGNNAGIAIRNLFTLLFKAGFSTVRNKLYDIIANRDDTYEEKYRKWCSFFDTVSPEQFNKIKELSAKLNYQPVFSIVMPVYNPPVKFLKKAIESVRNQAYTKWELCIADDKSTNAKIRSTLLSYQSKDPRIKVVFREENGHISRASNSALSLASGDYIALLDQDDELPAHSLYAVAKVINDKPSVELIYSDEDKIDEQGRRFDPYFKTDWNRDLFYGHNMISHLGVYKHSLIKKIGGFQIGFEGSQDYDLALRSIEQLMPDQIHHIPHVLYHWRAIKGSTAVTVSNKNYAMIAGLNALQQHLERLKKNARAIENIHNSYRVVWSLPDNPPLVSIIIPTKDKVDILKNCVSSVLSKTDYKNYEILIVDNHSSDKETLDYFASVQEQNSNVTIHEYPKEFNFSAIQNYGAKKAKGEIILLLNNDTEVINKEWLGEMVSHCLRPEIGAVGAKLFYPNGQIQHAGVFLYDGHPGNHIYLKRLREDLGYFNKLNLVQDYSAVTAACLAVRKNVFWEANGFDEENLRVAYNDVDFCLKLRELGYINLWTPFAQLYHHESISRGDDMHENNYARFKKEHTFMLTKWKKVIAHDPYFNPNLYIETQSNQFAFPPKIRHEWAIEVNNEKIEKFKEAQEAIESSSV